MAEITFKKERKKKDISTLNLDLKKILVWQKPVAKFTTKNKKIFFEDLSILLSSGIDLVNALKLVVNSFKKVKDQSLIKEFIKELTDGHSLFQVLKDSKRFSPYEYYSIKIGEETGRLNQVLTELSKYENDKIEQQKKVISAFSYPSVILLTAILAVGFMLNFIVPMFEEIFKRFDKDLPYLTKAIIYLSEHIGFYFFVLVSIIFGVYLIHKSLSTNNKYLTFISSSLIKLPVFGKLIRKIVLAKFCLAMELLLSAKTPLVECLKLSGDMINLYILKTALITIHQDILNGSSLNKSMEKFEIFDNRMIALIKVAEEVNKLEEIFGQVKNQLNKDIEYQTGIISSIMEPLLIVFIGFFVGLILISMYLPIFQISTSFM